MIDPIVEEFRAYRQAHAAQYNNDLDAICEALRAEELVSESKFVRGETNQIKWRRLNALGVFAAGNAQG